MNWYKVANKYDEFEDFLDEFKWHQERGIGSSLTDDQIRTMWSSAPVRTVGSKSLDYLGNTYSPEVAGRGVERRIRKFIENAKDDTRDDVPQNEWSSARSMDPDGYLKKLIDIVSAGTYPPVNVINVKGVGKIIVGGRTRAAAARALGVPLKVREMNVNLESDSVNQEVKDLFYRYKGKQ